MLKKGKPYKKSDGTIGYKPYKIKVFNTVDFSESMHYNPFAYFRDEHLTEDIKKFIEIFIANTSNKSSGGDEFWVNSEKLLYTAYIAAIFAIVDEKDRNINTLCDMVTNSSVSDDEGGGEQTAGKMDILFEGLEQWINLELVDGEHEKYSGVDFSQPPTEKEIEIGQYAVNYYKRFKQGAGKTLQSILISCSVRLSVFDTKSVAEITSKDDLELDKIGDELTALFIIVSDSNSTFDFLVAILYSQMYDLLFDKAYKLPGNRLPIHVRCILDEFANSGRIPDFEKKNSVFRSRNISACVILQAMSQLKSLYKDDADTIIAGCDQMLTGDTLDTDGEAFNLSGGHQTLISPLELDMQTLIANGRIIHRNGYDFGGWNYSPCYNFKTSPHTGIDIYCTYNEPIFAAGDGTIRNIGTSSFELNVKNLPYYDAEESTDVYEIYTVYSNARLAGGLSDGSSVEKGELIGYVTSDRQCGENGTSYYLHFKIRAFQSGEKNIDPFLLVE